MVSVSPLEFANTHRPIYFEPETDLEVFDEDEEVWNPLFKTLIPSLHSLTRSK